jgi:hypothetical protein
VPNIVDVKDCMVTSPSRVFTTGVTVVLLNCDLNVPSSVFTVGVTLDVRGDRVFTKGVTVDSEGAIIDSVVLVGALLNEGMLIN